MTATTVDHRRTELAVRAWGHRFAPPIVAVLVAAATATVALDQPIAALAAGAAVAALVIGDRPQAATVVCVGLVFSNAVVVATTEHGVPKLFAALVPLLLLVTIGHRTCIERQPLVLPRATPWVVAFLVVQLVGGATSRQPATSLNDVTTFVVEGMALWILLANAARGADVIRACAVVLVMSAAALSLLSVAQESGIVEDGDAYGFAQVSDAVVAEDEAAGQEGESRHAGPVGEQNRWAQCLALVIPLAVALAARDRSRTVRLIALAAVPAIGAGIVLTYSRGAAVGLVLATLVAVMLRWVPRAATVAALALVVVALAVGAPVFASRASTVVTARSSATGGDAVAEGGETDGSFSNRAVEASAAVAVFVHHPLVGVGPGLFPTYFQDEARRLGADRIVGVDREAHNLYLGIAADTGALGIGAFVGIVVTILRPLAAVRRRFAASRPDLSALATGYAMAIVVYLTTGLFLHFAYIRYFWLFAGLAAAMGVVDDATDGAPSRVEPADAPVPEPTCP
ncbi:O-antigen ligase family protein [Iamia sp. SCSIO 61187]|uniref:O-antigen ligase family protein n=1 Tax=Iamia sp. SCSIO 61187 TaxID=2722752 RepID=UPI001C6338F6|nr:O-antigen ligase family protein [Iamia sp. SCSIO 61187]QYG92256.1 O-antigen ligase family protein [Iamia sp. SCSIO 61187]